MVDDKAHIYCVGALSLDGLHKMDLPDWRKVASQFEIPNTPFILVTFHPETVDLNKNEEYCSIINKALGRLCRSIHLVITLANADAMGSLYRDVSKSLKRQFPSNISLVDNFGRDNYFAAMKASSLLMGNTSSGILEAASFGKYVINIGDRQKGRLRSDNVIDVPFDETKIVEETKTALIKGDFKGKNRYFQPNTADKIIKHLINA